MPETARVHIQERVGRQPAPSPDADRLDTLLRDLAAAYERLDALADARRSAVAGADLAALARVVREENEVVQRVASLDTERESIVREMAQGPPTDDAPEPDGVTLSMLADRLAEPARGATLDAARRLRALIERVRLKNAASRRAVERLALHMRGVLAAAESVHSHTGAYGPRGAVRPGGAVVSALDCTT
ncbi:MAG: flagellar protein FlgN [Planctomycetota bacterium]|nr:MAG: flagellar protein FlgN [Planctomycetota bacterium]